MGIEMDPSVNLNSLNNITLEKMDLEGYEGIDNTGKISAIFDHNANLTKDVIFNSRGVKRYFSSDKSIKQSEDKHAYQKGLADRRAEIFLKIDNSSTGETESGVEIESELLQLADDCDIYQKFSKNDYIKAQGFRKQINHDIKIYFSNKIKQASSANKLEELHDKIQKIELKIDKDVMDKLQKELDHQCDRVAKNLEVHIETADLGSMPPKDVVSAKCRCVIAWSKAVQTVSPKSFGTHHKRLGKLLIKTYSTGLDSVTPDETNLGITKQQHSKIEQLSIEVKNSVIQTLGEKTKYLKTVNNAKIKCLSALKKELRSVPKLVTGFINEIEKIEKLKQKASEQKTTLENMQQTKKTKTTARADLKSKKKQEFFGGYKLLRQLDKDYQNKVGNLKKEMKALSQKIDQTNTAFDSVKWKIEQAENKMNSLSEVINQSINKYGNSLKGLNEFRSLQQMNTTALSLEQLVAAFEKNPQQTKVTKLVPKRKAPEIPVLVSQKSIVVQDPSDDSIASINTNLDFCSDGEHENPNVSQEDLVFIENLVEQAMENESVNNDDLNCLFDIFLTALDQNIEHNGVTIYHGNIIIPGFDKALNLLESCPYQEAEEAFFDALKSGQASENTSVETAQSQESTQQSTTDIEVDDIEVDFTTQQTVITQQPSEAESQSDNKRSSLLEQLQQGMILKQTDTKPVKIPRPMFPMPATREAHSPLSEELYELLADLAIQSDNSSDYNDFDGGFDENDSDFDDLPLVIQEEQKDTAIQEAEKLLAAREPFFSMNDEKIREAATEMCNLKDITKEKILDVTSQLKTQ